MCGRFFRHGVTWAEYHAALSLILHEFPEGVIAFAILRRHAFSNRQAFFYAFLAAAATTPLGVLFASPFMYTLGPETIGSLFAVSAGLLLYVATGPLMEPLRDTPPARSLVALGTGVLIAVGIAMLPVHDHDDAEDHAGHHHHMDAPDPLPEPIR